MISRYTSLLPVIYILQSITDTCIAGVAGLDDLLLFIHFQGCCAMCCFRSWYVFVRLESQWRQLMDTPATRVLPNGRCRLVPQVGG